jgi:heme-degrading monooxygenase HmoA
MRVTIGRIRSGCWEQYEDAYRLLVESQSAVSGLRARWLARSTSDPDFCLAVSLWESREAMESYERSDAVKREILPHLAPYLSGDFVAHHCEVQAEHLPWAEVRALVGRPA